MGSNISGLVTVGITTKNRIDTLCHAIRKLNLFAHAISEILVVDDGSDVPICASSLTGFSGSISLIRHQESKGLIVSRNELVNLCRTDLLISCDDDSYPENGDLVDACAYILKADDIFALAFPYREGPDRGWRRKSAKAFPYPVRAYVGCAHLIKVRAFKEIGLYNEWLFHQCEEQEIGLRAFALGYRVYHYPGLVFYHEYTSAGRDMQRMDFYGFRNSLYISLRFYPVLFAGYSLFRAVLRLIFANSLNRRLFARALKGAFEGAFRDRNTRRFGLVLFKAYRDLPEA